MKAECEWEKLRGFVSGALEGPQATVWDLGNEVLYRLCAEYPNHLRPDVIIAKVWLIGRAYATAIERRRKKGNALGDKFYTELVGPCFLRSGIDTWFGEFRIKESQQRRSYALQLHNNLKNLLKCISGLEKRSFASKYLHFHFPEDFYIFDSRADKAVTKILAKFSKNTRFKTKCEGTDPVYARFTARCEQLEADLSGLIGCHLSPRALDKVLLGWDVND